MKENKTKNRCKDCVVKSNPVYSLKDEELEILCRNSTEIFFEDNERIIKQGAFTQNIVFIKSGVVKIHLKGARNKDEILQIDKGPFFVSVPDVFANKIHTYSVTALGNTSACFINYAGYELLIDKNPKFALSVIKMISKDFVNHYKHYVSKIQKQLTALMAETLLYFADHIYENDTFQIPLTRTELGEYIGTSRETVTKIIHDLASDNTIKVEGKTMQLINKKFLKIIANAG